MLYAVSPTNEDNRRTDNRLDISLKVEVTYGDGSKHTLTTRNMSTTGLFLEHDEQPVPEPGSTVYIQVSSELGLPDAPLVKATVVRKTDEGFGVMFQPE